MPGLFLPQSTATLLLWIAPACLLVLLILFGIWRARGRNSAVAQPSSDPPLVFFPVPEGDRSGPRPSSTGWLRPRGFRKAIGVAIVATAAGGTGALLYARSMESGEAGADLGERRAELRMLKAPAFERPPVLAQPEGPVGSERATAIDPESGDRLILWAGQDQVGRPGRKLRESIAVVVLDADDQPVADRGVRFELSPAGGELGSPLVRTRTSGLAMTSWRLGSDPDSLRGTVYLADRPAVRLEFSARLETASYASRTALVAPPGAAPTPLVEDNGERSEPDPDANGRVPGPGSPTTLDRAVEVHLVAAPLPNRRWAVGGAHTCLLGTGGGASCVGSAEPALTGVAELGSGVRAVSAGVLHMCAITMRSTVVCRAVGGGGDRSMAGERALPLASEPVELAVGSEHVCVRASSGDIHCWGKGERGQLGTGLRGEQREPALVTGLEGVVQLVSGWAHTCALTGAGQLYCWGANSGGQLGLGNREDRSQPAAVAQPAPFSRVTAGSAHTCGLTRGGEAWCWGENRYGQLGTGTGTTAVPVRVQTELTFVEVTAGGVHTCGLTSNGAAWCWGRNVFGQLGDGSSDDAAAPVPVRSEHRFRVLAAGGAHTCGETAAGELYCWGNNIQGQLGDGSRESRQVPVRSAGAGTTVGSRTR